MTEHRKLHAAEEAVTEPLSPELALVDPQLATRARERLRAFGEGVAFQRRAVAPARQGARDPGAISPDDVEGDPSFASGHRRPPPLVVAASAVLAAAAVTVFTSLQRTSDIGGGVSGRASPSVERITVRRAERARQEERASERSRARARTASPKSNEPPVQSKKRPRPAPRSEFPTRVFVWPAVSRATFYKVEFFRRGRKIFEASPSEPRIELPLRWVYRGRHFRLTRATYRWEVRAAFGSRARPRFGKLITRSTWAAR